MVDPLGIFMLNVKSSNICILHYLLDDSIPEPTVVDPAHLPPVIKSYEDLLRSHINHISSVVASHASDTELSKRVNEWEEKIKPRLNEIVCIKKYFTKCLFDNLSLSLFLSLSGKA